MSILKIAKIGHPILFQKALPIDNIETDNLKSLVINMSETMLDSNGIGLAAPQIHINKRIIIFRTQIEEVENEELDKQEQKIKIEALVNPTYKKDTNEVEDDWEGCLSIPGMLGKVRRYKKITYQGFDLKGNLVKKKAQGMLARVVQHECDHLDGILYTSKLTDPKDFGFVDEINKYFKNEKQKF